MIYRGKEIYLAKFDVVFKAVFIGDGDYSLLASLLSSILNISIKSEDIVLLNVELAPEHKSGRLARLDIRVKTVDRHINVEIQLYDRKNMDKRSIFYTSKLYTGQMSTGMKFNNLAPAIAINILDFEYLPYIEYHNVYRLKNVRTNDELTDVFEINFIELPKVPPEINNNPKDLWARFLAAESEEELDMLTEQNPILDKAVKKLVYVSADELVRYEMEMREKIELDYQSDMKDNFDKGVEEKSYRAAERALRKGVSPDDVAYVLELPLSIVLEIKKNIR